MERKYRKYFYYWFAIISIFCILLDLFMSTIQPSTSEGNQGSFTENFDGSLINQFVFLSVWTTICISIWAICNILEEKWHKMPKWVKGKNNDTFIVTLSTIMFLVYGSSIAFNPNGVVGFDTWYKILKSSLEHFLDPLLLILFYLIAPKEIVDEKEYAKKFGWYVLIIPAIYIAIMVIRELMLVNFDPAYKQGLEQIKQGIGEKWPDVGLFPAFPYDSVDPYLKSPQFWIIGLIAFFGGLYGVANLFNRLSNQYAKHLINKHEFVLDIADLKIERE